MPPKKTNNDDAGAAAFSHGYTDGELQLMIAIIKRIDRPANLDADAIALEIGSASGGSVRKRISNAVAKRGWFSGGAPPAAEGDDAGGAPPATPAAKKPRAKRAPKNKKAPEDDGENGDEGDEQEAPKKKKARTTKAKAKPKAQSEEENPVKGEDDEGAEGEI